MAKNSKIRLSEEGFSYHTIELKLRMDRDKYDALLTKLYKTQTCCLLKYPDNRCHNCRYLQSHGINLYFTQTKHNRYVVKAVVNPRRVLDPDSGYEGIMSPCVTAQMKFEKEFYKLMRQIDLPDIEEWEITRVDLCVNLQCEYKETASEILRLLNKAPLPARMKRQRFVKKDASEAERNEQQKKDHHSVRVVLAKGISLTVYDKLFQMETERLPGGKSKRYRGVLRVELKWEKDSLEQFRRQFGVKDGSFELLRALTDHSAEFITTAVKTVFGSGEYRSAGDIKRLIDRAHFQKETRRQLKRMVDRMRYPFDMEQLEEGMKKEFGVTPRVIQERLDMLRSLGVDPIPLRADFYLDRMPSLYQLLMTLRQGNGKTVLTQDGVLKEKKGCIK